MLIKVYTHAFPTVLHILENVTDVRIDKNIYPLGQMGSIESPSIGAVYTFDDVVDPPEQSQRPIGNCFIDFTRNGIRARLLVSNYAYVCNDDGRTIEKVSTQ